MPAKHIVTALALHLLINTTCSAQTSVLNRYYDWGHGKNRYLNFWDVMYTGDSLTILGEIADDSIPFRQNPFLARLDTLGNLARISFFYDPLGQSQNLTNEYSRITQTSDSGYIFTSGAFNRADNFLLFKTNRHFQVEFIHEYPLYNDVVFDRNIIETSDAYYLGFDLSTRQGDDNDYCVVKTDKQGNKLWHRLYGLPDRREVLYAMKSSKEGEIHLFGTNDDNQGNLMVIDTSGSVIRSIDLRPNQPSHPKYDFDILENGDIICVGYVLDIKLPGYLSETWVYRFDSTGREIWSVRQGGKSSFNYLVRMVRNSDGSFTAGGLERVRDTSRAKAIRITTDGDILWQSYFHDMTSASGLDNHRNGIHGMAMLPGGNVIACGSFDDFKDNRTTKGFLLKIWPDGCIDTLCSTLLDTEAPLVNKNERITVYPNPARDVLMVHIPADADHDALRLELADLLGRPVQSQRLIPGENTIAVGSYVTPGVYIYTISGRGGSISAGKVVILK